MVDELMPVVEGKKKAVIVDVRAPDEYEGTDVLVLREGHLPKAINIDYSTNFDPESYRILSLPELRSLYKDYLPTIVSSHYQTGSRAAYTYLVLRALGYKDVAVYLDCWRGYGSTLSLPV